MFSFVIQDESLKNPTGDQESRKVKKSPPKGREGGYKENSDFLRTKTNRWGRKHKVY
jgi:hypothetical protein